MSPLSITSQIILLLFVLASAIGIIVGIMVGQWKGLFLGLLVGFGVQLLLLVFWVMTLKKQSQSEGDKDTLNNAIMNIASLVYETIIMIIFMAIFGSILFYKYLNFENPSIFIGILGFFLAPILWWCSTMSALRVTILYSNDIKN